MKLNKTISLILFIALFIISVLAIAVSSETVQWDPYDEFTRVQKTPVNDKISIEVPQDCIRQLYETTEPVYDWVTKERQKQVVCYDATNDTYTLCNNGTESYQAFEIVSFKPTLANRTACSDRGEFVVAINGGGYVTKKRVDFSNWGVCVQSSEGDCLVLLCGTLAGGSARNGVFNGCDGGKSCQKFTFCEDGTRVQYKAAESDFVDEDPTFMLQKLEIKEVGK